MLLNRPALVRHSAMRQPLERHHVVHVAVGVDKVASGTFRRDGIHVCSRGQASAAAGTAQRAQATQQAAQLPQPLCCCVCLQERLPAQGPQRQAGRHPVGQLQRGAAAQAGSTERAVRQAGKGDVMQ